MFHERRRWRRFGPGRRVGWAFVGSTFAGWSGLGRDRELFTVRPRTTPIKSSINSLGLLPSQASPTCVGVPSEIGR